MSRHRRISIREEARRIYHQSKQVSSVTYNLFAIAKKLDSEPRVAGISAPLATRESARNELIKHYPTLESLFGSMDFCECEHCRSVLSPAAYLVDLLQFVDLESGVWANFLAHWRATHRGQDYPHRDSTGRAMKPYDVLIERRPDLPHISLTCENTHTALPYIDIVNEVLEYFVAHGKLEAQAARDTGEAATADLLAEPQNVIREAYEALKAARYPLNLPFDLWLETVRQFCGYFETPLHRVLEVLRPADDLLASAQLFDRAAIFVESLGLSPSEADLFTEAAPLTNDRWHELYGFPSVRPVIQNPTNAGDATLSVPNDDAAKLTAGLAYTFFDTSANGLSAESRIITSLGAADSGGAGRTTVGFSGVWTTPPDAGDLLVCDAPEMLRSAKALSRRLGVTYKEIAEVIQTGFVNPDLTKLSLLYRLGVTIQDARFDKQHKTFHDQNHDLIGKERSALSAADQLRFDALSGEVPNSGRTGWEVLNEVAAFERRLNELATEFNHPLDVLQTAIQNIPFEKVLVLADPNTGCDFDLTTLQYSDTTKADPIVFLRINLFVRLWRRLGWSIEETDRALQAFVPKSAPYELASGVGVAPEAHLAKQPLRSALIYLAHLKALEERLKVGKQGRLKLICLWSDLPTTGKKPLYAQLFLTRSVLKSSAVFDDPLGKYLEYFNAGVGAYQAFHWDPLQPEDRATGNVSLRSNVLALQGALGLTADEIGRILPEVNKSLAAAELSLANVSLLYRYGLLAKALKLTVRDLIVLKQLSGLDPFRPLHPDPLATLAEDHPFSATLEFVTVAEEVRNSGLTVETLDYLLRHRFDDTGRFGSDPEGTLGFLKSLSDGIRAIRAEHSLPEDPGALNDEVLRQKLGLALAPEVAATFQAMMNGTAEFTATQTGTMPVNQLRPEGFADEPSIREVSFNAARQEQKLTYRGVLFDPKKTALKARLPKLAEGIPHEPSALLGGLLDEVQQQAQTFFNQHLLKTAAGTQPASGFLEAADFDLLFQPAPAGLTEAEQQARERQRRTRLARALFPFLQDRLIRQFVAQTMTAKFGADPELTEGLLFDPRLLASPGPLGDSLAATAGQGLTGTFFGSVDATTAVLATATLGDADTGFRGADGNPLRPAGTQSVRIEGCFQVPTPGAYRFLIELEKQNAEVQLRFPHLQDPLFLTGAAAADHATLGDQPSQFLELKGGVLYRLSAELKNLNGGEARVLIQGEALAKGPLSRLILCPSVAIAGGEGALTLLSKVLLLTQSLGVSEREIRFLLAHAADFGGVNLSELPIAAVGDTPAELAATQLRFSRFRRWAAYARLKREPAGGTNDLIEIFEANANPAADRLDKLVYPLLARLTRREAATVKATAETLSTAPAFASEQPLGRLWEALQVVERFGVPLASLAGWTGIVNRGSSADRQFGMARDVKEAIKARFDTETWQRVAQPIFDKLRQRQRDALASHVMHQHGFDRLEQLYEYFLMDPGMEPVVQTSRIRLAIASLQLFVQRCLLNLEPKVHPSAINGQHWEWMKRYRVWEANRKIFLFPENWLEPEFRDDKTHLFAEVEGALLQGDVSIDLVEDAFLNYLRKLDELARLEIVAMHIEDDPDPARRTLHVFGRTYSQPHKHFYRRFAKEMWTPWEPVGAEIEGNHLAPVVWRDRLYLFWVTFIEQAIGPESATTVDPTKAISIPAVSKRMEAQLHWSEYLQGTWTTRESGGFTPTEAQKLTANAVDPRKVFIHVVKEPYEDGEERGVFIVPSLPFIGSFYLAGRNCGPEKRAYHARPSHPYTPAYGTETCNAAQYTGSGPFKVTFANRIVTTNGEWSPGAAEPRDILQSGGNFALLPCNSNLTALGVSEDAYRGASDPEAVKAALERGVDAIASLIKPVFYQDSRNTFFIEPDLTERTLEQWEEWVTRTPEVEPDWGRPDWWEKLEIIPEIPHKGPIPYPGDPWRLPVGEDSLLPGNPKEDWLINPVTAFAYGSTPIGKYGQAGLELVTPGEESLGKELVEVNPGGAVAGGAKAVLTDRNAFARSGLKADGRGLNVVGVGGFDAAQRENLDALSRAGFGDRGAMR